MQSAPSTNSVGSEFIRFAIETGVLRFGEFKLKSGRLSPYFFNAGGFDDGAKLLRLCTFYARTILASGIEFDVLFGPAYKGITLAAGTAIELARLGRNTPYAFNRKEAKDHGEGGTVVGAPLTGNVLIIDDVISAGTSVNESVHIIRSQGATPCGVVIALDRMEKGRKDGVDTALSAVQEVNREHSVSVLTIATLDDVLAQLQVSSDARLLEFSTTVAAYRAKYSVQVHGQV